MQLIDIDAINWYDDLFMKGVNHSGVWVRYRDVEHLIRNAPTVDAVEVVRCKDCKWYGSERNECHNPRYGNGWANYPSPSINEEYYCADGERREEGK